MKITIQAHAKINWTLDITGRRADGYHMMDMLMQPITLSDTVTLEDADEITLTTSGTPYIPADPKNLAYRAAAALQKETGCTKGVHIHVHKQIPSGAGLGGGSSDAAAVLAGLNRLWRLNLSQAELERIGLTLGADVPFCLHGGLARVRGIGEEMEDVHEGHAFPLVIVQPCEGLSTKEVFEAYHTVAPGISPDTNNARESLRQGKLVALAPSLGNVLQAASRMMAPPIGQAVDALWLMGAACAAMSGSGSAVYGAFTSVEAAYRAADSLRSRWERVFVCETCSAPYEMVVE